MGDFDLTKCKDSELPPANELARARQAARDRMRAQAVVDHEWIDLLCLAGLVLTFVGVMS